MKEEKHKKGLRINADNALFLSGPYLRIYLFSGNFIVETPIPKANNL
jgi:hypothetical protein